MKKDIDYIVKDGEVLIVDEFTGRIMYGRRYNNGLHQAIEAKEHVKIADESKTLATITFQNFFRMYDKLSGMTGTAMTEAAEFEEIYNLDVVEIPTNKPMIRKDENDVIYLSLIHILGAIIISEIGDITRFSSATKLLAFAGLDPSVRQSGNFNANNTTISKRGSKHLRFAINYAAELIIWNDDTFSQYYTMKLAQRCV